MTSLTNRELLIELGTRMLRLENAMGSLAVKVGVLENKIDVIDKRTESYPKLYDNVDKLIGEIMENRQERTFMSSKLGNHENRLATLEKFH